MSSSCSFTPLLTSIRTLSSGDPIVSYVSHFHRSMPYLFQKSHDLPIVSPLLMVGSVP